MEVGTAKIVLIIRCPRCKGTGRQASEGSTRVRACPDCSGTGERTEKVPVQDFLEEVVSMLGLRGGIA